MIGYLLQQPEHDPPRLSEIPYEIMYVPLEDATWDMHGSSDLAEYKFQRFFETVASKKGGLHSESPDLLLFHQKPIGQSSIILIRNKTTCYVILVNCEINTPENIPRKYYGCCFSHLTMGTPIVLLTGHWQDQRRIQLHLSFSCHFQNREYKLLALKIYNLLCHYTEKS
ncbi:hypothetical protein KKI24_00450 [bacterium]|nr:hypothetical protein [bacterium]